LSWFVGHRQTETYFLCISIVKNGRPFSPFHLILRFGCGDFFFFGPVIEEEHLLLVKQRISKIMVEEKNVHFHFMVGETIW